MYNSLLRLVIVFIVVMTIVISFAAINTNVYNAYNNVNFVENAFFGFVTTIARQSRVPEDELWFFNPRITFRKICDILDEVVNYEY